MVLINFLISSLCTLDKDKYLGEYNEIESINFAGQLADQISPKVIDNPYQAFFLGFDDIGQRQINDLSPANKAPFLGNRW